MKKNAKIGLLILISSLCINVSVYGQQLNAKQAAIVPISAYAALGDQTKLKDALGSGLQAGLTISEIKEILVQLYAYAGFPRSLNAISTFQTVVNDRRHNGINDVEGNEPSKINFGSNKYQFGKDVQAKLTGKSANSTQAFVPLIDTFLKEHLFADIFGRDNLDYQSREINTISILATIGGVEAQLRSHLGVGRNVGLSEQQLRGIAAILSVTVNEHAGSTAIKIIDNMFNATPNTIVASQAQGVVAEPIFSKGNKVSNGNFNGDVWVNMLTSVDTAVSTSVGNVTFAPKARSKWHLHPSGQILLVTDGIGYYQEKDQPIRLIRKGDVIKCTVGVSHWHGASHESSMSHIALGPNNGKGVVKWLENVTDEEYNKIIDHVN